MKTEFILQELQQIKNELLGQMNEIETAMRVIEMIGARDCYAVKPITTEPPLNTLTPKQVKEALAAPKPTRTTPDQNRVASEKTCVTCGKKYKPTCNVQRYCGDDCNPKLNKKKPIILLGITNNLTGEQMELTPEAQDIMNHHA